MKKKKLFFPAKELTKSEKSSINQKSFSKGGKSILLKIVKYI